MIEVVASKDPLGFEIASFLVRQAPLIASIVSLFWRVERRSIFGLKIAFVFK